MKWNKKDSYISFNDENIMISYWCDWIQWLPNSKIKWNWKNLNIVNIIYENDIMCGGREIEVGLLGFCLRVRWTYETEQSKELHKTTKEAIASINLGFDGWAAKKDIEQFRNKKRDYLTMGKTRKTARQFGIINPKKLFIQ